MRPRSRLLTKRGVMLPTIREGTEENVKDLNEANALQLGDKSHCVSSEDYLLSICHLARPTTFPVRDTRGVAGGPQQDSVQQRLRQSPLIPTALSRLEIQHHEDARGSEGKRHEGRTLNGELMCCKSDPLEYLYGSHSNVLALPGSVRKALMEGTFARGQARTRANGIPHATGPDLPSLCKNTCPEIHSEVNSDVSEQHVWSRSGERETCPAEKGAEGQRLYLANQPSLFTQWISDCRSAWRGARLRACMLPAIAEV